LFGVVILGMLWKRATPAGGFWGFLMSIGLSLGMWVFVHSFPEGYRPPPKIVLGKGAVVKIENGAGSQTGKMDRVLVISGEVDAVNVPMGTRSLPAGADFTVGDGEIDTPSGVDTDGQRIPVRVLAESVVLAGTGEKVKFGEDGLPLVLKPGVKVRSADVTQWFNPAQFNPSHTKYIARSEKAKPMAVNVYSAIWTILACLTLTIVVSLFTTSKPDAELKNLVMGLTPLPVQGSCPWYERPKVWAALLFLAILALNVAFW
jgi:hypothetical protein